MDNSFGDEVPNEQPASDDKPFDAEPFNAGVEADEESDPKKFIEQLTGKLGQSLRKYNENQGQPDFELEKFAINSLLSATHTSEMDSNDQEDIIKKVKTAGNGDNGDDENQDNDNDSESEDSGDTSAPSSTGDNVSNDFGGGMGDNGGGASDGGSQGGEVSEGKNQDEMNNIFVNPKKNNMFQPGSNDVLNLDKNLKESKKSSIFGKDKIKLKLQETFNQEDMSEPVTEPMVKPSPSKPAPTTTPNEPKISPSRRNKPFLPMPDVQPDPKAIK